MVFSLYLYTLNSSHILISLKNKIKTVLSKYYHLKKKHNFLEVTRDLYITLMVFSNDKKNKTILACYY